MLHLYALRGDLVAKVILICGKICSGKTYYSKCLQKKYNAVLLSCDEIENQIFHHSLGEKHDTVVIDIKNYLHKKALDILSVGSNVVLDWGFWTKAERENVTCYYQSKGIEYEWHYVDVTDEIWKCNISSRNESVLSGESDDYYVDDGLLCKIQSLFEIPSHEEIDVWYSNQRKMNPF